MNMWGGAFDMANEAVEDIRRQGTGPTADQKIALAQVYATLSVSQELSRMIMDEGLTVRIDDEKPSRQRASDPT